MVESRYGRYVTNSLSELEQANRSPIDGYQDRSLMSLKKAIESITPFIDNLTHYADDAKQKCNRSLNILTWDESAAIYLYTMSTPFIYRLNERLRAEDRHTLKPWFDFLRLFISALEKCPSSTTTVWRGVTGQIAPSYFKNNVQRWWSVNSCSTSTPVVKCYLGENGTLFAIDVIHGKEISNYSAFPEEHEIILMPATFLRLKSDSLNFRDCVRFVLLVEIVSIEPTTESEQSTNISDVIIDTDNELLIIPTQTSSRHILNPDAKWKQNGTTVVGGNGKSDGMHQLNFPFGLYVDDNKEIVYIADSLNHRIVVWKVSS